MRGRISWKAVILSGAALFSGCASGGGGPSAAGVCEDRSRFGFPDRLSREQLEEVRAFIGGVGAPGADFFPITSSPPDVLNRREIARALEREYPPVLRDGKISGTAEVTMLVTESGRVEEVGVLKSAGHPRLDEAAIRVAQ